MIKKDRITLGEQIKYELAEGTHTYTMCSQCRYRRSRSSRCWECWLKVLVEGKSGDWNDKNALTSQDNSQNKDFANKEKKA